MIGLTNAGCSGVSKSDTGKIGYKPAALDVDEARKKARDVSGQLVKIIGVHGKLTEPGPSISTCEDAPASAELYATRHPWSVYDITEEELLQGMNNLRNRLPDHDWHIVKDGKSHSKAQSSEILAENKTEKFAAHFTALRKTASGDTMISVTVVSACYRAPAGTDLDREY